MLLAIEDELVVGATYVHDIYVIYKELSRVTVTKVRLPMILITREL